MNAKGISFAIGDGGSPTELFTPIPHVTEFDWSDRNWDTEETTAHDSTEPVRTYNKTVYTDGQITLTFNPFIASDPAHAAIKTALGSSTAVNFKVTYPGGLIGPFVVNGLVLSAPKNTPVDGNLTMSVTIMVNGAADDLPAQIASLTVTDTEGGVYVTGEKIKLKALFDEYLTVTGTPRIAIVLDSGTVHALKTAVGGNIIDFEYTFGGGDQGNAGEVSITSPIDLNGGTIKDAAGQNATLTFTPPLTSAFTVNAI